MRPDARQAWSFLITFLATAALGGVVLTVVGRSRGTSDSSAPEDSPAPPRALPSRMPPAQPPSEYLDGIMRRNLFDVAVLEAWNPGDGASGPVAATLDVTLIGTVVTEQPELSTALIRHETDGSTHFYGHGGLVFGHRIEQIEPRMILLVAPNGVQSILRTTNQGAEIMMPERGMIRSPSADAQLGENHIGIASSVFESVDLTQLVKDGQLSQVRDQDGVVLGLGVTGAAPGGFADRMGLQDGDVLMAVEDQRFDDLARASTWLRSLPGRPAFCAEVERGGIPSLVCYDLQ